MIDIIIAVGNLVRIRQPPGITQRSLAQTIHRFILVSAIDAISAVLPGGRPGKYSKIMQPYTPRIRRRVFPVEDPDLVRFLVVSSDRIGG